MNKYLERLMYDSSNRLDSYTTSFSRRLFFEGERYVKDQIFNSLKIKYGKEIIVKNNNSDSKIWKWLKDHDPKFNKRPKNAESGMLTNTMYIINIDKNTFAFVRVGSYCYTDKDFLLFGNSNESDKSSDLNIYIFGLYARKYIEEVELITGNTKEAGHRYVYSVSGNNSKDKDAGDDMRSIVSDMQTRNIDTLFYNDGVKENILSHIDGFIENQYIYKERNLLYKTGILLYGIPGTGKTSLATALATYYNYDLIIVDMNTFDRLDVSMLTNCINADTSKFIVLLEDIDTIFNTLNREDSSQSADKDEKKVINKLLQFLDSNSSPTDVIFIATTNHIEKLDSALTRSGRFDLIQSIDPVNKAVAHEMCKSFNVPEEDIDSIIREAGDGIYNQSTLQADILAYFKKKERGVIEDEQKNE